jgi:hypothetical protein
VTVRPEPEVDQVKHRRRAGNLLEFLGVLCGSSFQVSGFHRHGINVIHRQPHLFEQTVAQLRQVAILMPGRGHSFVHLHHMHLLPRHVLI